jgi:hypothetical protein
MILSNAPQHEAVLSNVGEIGEFRIRNSAKAFNILSSGLYANKIRAIVRELSCNAVDSHVAAGKSDVPFEVHIPNSLEPHFSIRDYGTGLSHEQVTQIYTTYFESTKTASNEFIGALGLGSKSPFSYTDNFTVTAIQGGRKGIYSAFINGEGVPSIALMFDEQTDEAAGVEIKFSVNERYDFRKFADEAREVYRYFNLKPIISGSSDFCFALVDYESQNVIPGVSVLRSGNRSISSSVAVMGNISYPINVPNAKENLGELGDMLDCGLEMRFDIGELDFQASREGLSYIPQTIASIKAKLVELNSVLLVSLATEADAIDNLWDRAQFLCAKNEYVLWRPAIQAYITNTGLSTVENNYSYYKFLKTFKISVEDLASKYNINVRGFYRGHGQRSCSVLKADTYTDYDAKGNRIGVKRWEVPVANNTLFVINNTKVGATERAKYHFKQNNIFAKVLIIDAVDPTKEMNTEAFFNDIGNPPAKNVYKANDMLKKPRGGGVARNITIMSLESNYNMRGSRREYSWVAADLQTGFDSNVTYYYVPLSGFTMVGIATDVRMLQSNLKTCGIDKLKDIKIYGVRKADLDEVRALPNWVNVEDHIKNVLTAPDDAIIKTISLSRFDMFDFASDRYRNTFYESAFGIAENADSPYNVFTRKFKGFKRVKNLDHCSFTALYKLYTPTINLENSIDLLVNEFKEVSDRYPLLQYMSSDDKFPTTALADYINHVDTVKGI